MLNLKEAPVGGVLLHVSRRVRRAHFPRALKIVILFKYHNNILKVGQFVLFANLSAGAARRRGKIKSFEFSEREAGGPPRPVRPTFYAKHVVVDLTFYHLLHLLAITPPPRFHAASLRANFSLTLSGGLSPRTRSQPCHIE